MTTNDSKDPRAQSVYYCFSRQAFQEQIDMAAHRAKQLGNVHPSFRQSSVFHAHKHGEVCGGPNAWGPCLSVDPISGDKTPVGPEIQ